MFFLCSWQEVTSAGEGSNQIGMDMYTFCEALGAKEVRSIVTVTVVNGIRTRMVAYRTYSRGTLLL